MTEKPLSRIDNVIFCSLYSKASRTDSKVVLYFIYIHITYIYVYKHTHTRTILVLVQDFIQYATDRHTHCLMRQLQVISIRLRPRILFLQLLVAYTKGNSDISAPFSEMPRNFRVRTNIDRNVV